MSPRAKPYASRNYPNLFKYPHRSPNWVFRKYSAEKGSFTYSTGEAKNEAKAYSIGLKAFNDWLGRTHVQDEMPLFRDFAGALLRKKLALPDDKFSPNSKRASERDYTYLIEHFGDLRVDQMTPDRWEGHFGAALADRAQTFFNRRKALIEIMLKAVRAGLIQALPEYENPDAAIEEEEGGFLDDELVRRILEAADSDDQRLLIQIMWKQGARPGEILRYEWSMIKWKEGDHGFLRIPGRITKTRRARAIPMNPKVAELLRARQAASESRFVFPGRDNPETHQVEYKTGWSGACRRAADRIAVEIEELEKAGLPPKELREKTAHLVDLLKTAGEAIIYDLRGTFITNALDAGFSSTFIGKYCDTSSKMIDSRYARRKKSAMQAIANVGGAS